MPIYELHNHPSLPPIAIKSVEAELDDSHTDYLGLIWRVEGAGGLTLPDPCDAVRADELWRTTCFELFLRPEGGPKGGGAYVEYNFSPSSAWNAYHFDGYREGMREYAAAKAPECFLDGAEDYLQFEVHIPRAALPKGPCAAAITAVLEEADGNISYFALTHSKDTPDFHDPSCFTASFGQRQQA